MPYIGNPIYQSAFVTDQFSGTGSQTAYTMSVAPAGTSNVLVIVSGVVQDPSTYGVVGNTLTFSAAPPSGTGNISCRYLGVPVTGVVTTAYRTVTEFTATAGQTTFTPPSYTVGYINVYLNGVLLGSADYTATNGTTVVLATGASAGNLVTVESFLVSSVLNAIANSAGSVSSNNLAANSVTTTKIADANVTTAKLAATTGSGNVVLSTSPTLVTPALGTPSAINLANAVFPAGCVLQVVNSQYPTYTTSSNTSLVATGLTASITPKFATSKIFILVSMNGLAVASAASAMHNELYKNGISLAYLDDIYGYSGTMNASASYQYFDSPATTSSTTYAIYWKSITGTTLQINNYYTGANRTVSSMTLMEIAQ